MRDYADYDEQSLFAGWTLAHDQTTRCSDFLPSFATTVQCNWSCLQLSLQCSKGLTVAGSQYSVMTDMHEAIWKDMLSVASYELNSFQCHRLVLVTVLVVFVLEGDILVGDFLYAFVADCNSVSIPCKILQCAFCTADW